MSEYKAEFLWPHVEGSVEQAGYEFANARTPAYQRQWWKILLGRARNEVMGITALVDARDFVQEAQRLITEWQAAHPGKTMTHAMGLKISEKAEKLCKSKKSLKTSKPLKPASSPKRRG